MSSHQMTLTDQERYDLAEIEVGVVERRDAPGTWGVETINQKGDGEIYMAIFSGPLAKDRAREYARWQPLPSPPVINMRVCVVCGDKFDIGSDARKVKKRFCSNACKMKDYRQRKKWSVTK